MNPILGDSSESSSTLGGPWGGSSRREFLRLAAMGVAAAGAAASLSGCVLAAAGHRKLDFHDDFGPLNFAYALETVEAEFYQLVVANPPRDLRAGELAILSDIRDHEVVHRQFFKRALQVLRVKVPDRDFSSVDFTTRMGVLTQAKTFEDLGVAAYNGAGDRLATAEFLTIAGKIVSVEARHAAAIRDMLSPNSRDFAGDDVIDENGLDRAFEPGEVLRQAQRFFKQPFTAAGL